ncbi:MAG: hypothetical protein CML23_00015 [Rhizobiaceae bacterium]|nr:hypothetical protein [Rhizobiaceae bacterium]
MTKPLTHAGLPKGMTRWQLLDLLETGRRVLGLSKGDVAYLRFAISSTQDGDYEPGRICAFWPSVTEIAAHPKVAMDRRQISRIEAKLISSRFLVKSCSTHSGRRGWRVNGLIKQEFGINLAPLIDRAVDIRAAAQKAIFEQREARSLRHQIVRLFEKIDQLGDESARAKAEGLLPNRKPSTVQNYERLKRICGDLAAVLSDFSHDVGEGEMSHQTDISPLPNTKERKKIKTCRQPGPRKAIGLRTSPAQAWRLAGSVMRETIQAYSTALEPGRPPSWQVIELAARDRASQLGVTLSVWQQHCERLGASRTALCLLIADRNAERSDRFAVSDPAAAFVGMAREEHRQMAVLDALIGELGKYQQKSIQSRAVLRTATIS